MYVALFPCNECAKMIIQSGLKEVVYFSDKHADKPETKASKTMFDMAGIKQWQYIPCETKIVTDFNLINEKYTQNDYPQKTYAIFTFCNF